MPPRPEAGARRKGIGISCIVAPRPVPVVRPGQSGRHSGLRLVPVIVPRDRPEPIGRFVGAPHRRRTSGVSLCPPGPSSSGTSGLTRIETSEAPVGRASPHRSPDGAGGRLVRRHSAAGAAWTARAGIPAEDEDATGIARIPRSRTARDEGRCVRRADRPCLPARQGRIERSHRSAAVVPAGISLVGRDSRLRRARGRREGCRRAGVLVPKKEAPRLAPRGFFLRQTVRRAQPTRTRQISSA